MSYVLNRACLRFQQTSKNRYLNIFIKRSWFEIKSKTKSYSMKPFFRDIKSFDCFWWTVAGVVFHNVTICTWFEELLTLFSFSRCYIIQNNNCFNHDGKYAKCFPERRLSAFHPWTNKRVYQLMLSNYVNMDMRSNFHIIPERSNLLKQFKVTEMT